MDAIKEDVEKASSDPRAVRPVKRRWFGKRVVIEEKRPQNAEDDSERRPTMLYAPLYNGIAAGLSLRESPHFSVLLAKVALSSSTVFVGNGISEY